MHNNTPIFILILSFVVFKGSSLPLADDFLLRSTDASAFAEDLPEKIVASINEPESSHFNTQHRHLAQDISPPQSIPNATTLNGGLPPAWRGRIDPRFGRSFFAPSLAVNQCSGGRCRTKLGSYPYERYIIDPTSSSNMPVLQVSYPKGSWSANSDLPGGTLFYAYPFKADPRSTANPFSADSASLEYDVYFPPDFDFVKGGKLPGLSGGSGGSGRGCGGGVDPNNCFSLRVMWRRNGWGETYIYAPEGQQGDDFCSKYPECSNSGTGAAPCTVCNYNAGVSFARGSFIFKRGQWQRIRVALKLNNPPGTPNGIVELAVDGNVVIRYDKMNWRNTNDIKIEAIEFASWFGGSDESWAPSKDTYILFRNIKAYRSGPPTVTNTGTGRSATLKAGPVHQVVVSEVIQAGA